MEGHVCFFFLGGGGRLKGGRALRFYGRFRQGKEVCFMFFDVFSVCFGEGVRRKGLDMFRFCFFTCVPRWGVKMHGER